MKEKKEMKQKGRNEGITLVALVVTIVVLLILAGITITMIFSEDGVISKAEQTREATKKAEILDNIQMDILAKQVEKDRRSYNTK